MAIDLTQFHETFYEESFEGLDAMEQSLLNINIGHENTEDINTIFRGAHSIKGGSATFGFKQVADFTHNMESLLDEIRSGNRNITQADVDLFLQSVDCIRDMLSAIRGGNSVDEERVSDLNTVLESALSSQRDGDAGGISSSDEISEDEFDALLDKLHGSGKGPGAQGVPSYHKIDSDEITDAEFEKLLDQLHGKDGAPGIDQKYRSDENGWNISFYPHAEMMQNGNDPVRIFRELNTLGRVVTNVDLTKLPGLNNYVSDECYLGWNCMLYTNSSRDEVFEIFAWVEDESDLSITSLRSKNAAPKDKDIIASTEGGSLKAAVSERSDTAPQVQASIPPSNSPAPVMAPRAPAVSAESSSIRVSIEKIDELINMVGELVITQAMLSQIGKNFDSTDLPKMIDGLAELERNTRELQESTMRIRMLPISFAFNRFPRLVRDLSGKLGKKIELRLTGENTELDKTVMEKIGDPLVHLVRNSIDHGIEKPEARRKSGKPETGTVHLNAYHQGGNIVIEISDDGAGLDSKKLVAKAKEKGIHIDESKMTEQEIHELIFHPGFSTAEQVSDVSGRGVGMDVVRRNIRDLNGNVELTSKPGEGSTIRIRLPLTLAIMEGQLVRVGEETYIIPLVSIIETTKINDDAVNAVVGKGEVFRLRDNYIQIIRLSDVIDTQPKFRNLSQGLLVVVEGDGQRAGLFVDELLGQQQVVIKSLETNYLSVQGISGATILGDGSVALIMDIPGLIGLAHEMKDNFGKKRVGDGEAA